MGEKGTLTRRYILDCACPLFIRYGYKAVTMQDICRASGLSKGGLYRHYKDKPSLFSDLLQSFQEDREQHDGEGMDAGASARVLLEDYLFSQLGNIRDGKPGLYGAIYEFCLESRDTEDSSFLSKQYARGEVVLLALLTYGTKTGEFHPGNPKETAAAILFMIEGMKICREVMPITEEMLTGIYHQIKKLLGVSEQEPIC